MKRLIGTFLAGLCVLPLGGCVEDVGDDSSSETTIHSFSVTGSYESTDSVAHINTAAPFAVDWRVSATDPYRVALYVSHDNSLSDDDIDFFGQNCGSLSTLYDCWDTGNFSCTFDTDNRVLCGEESYGNRGAYLTEFFSQLPESAYLILKACDSLFQDCKTTSRAVRFE